MEQNDTAAVEVTCEDKLATERARTTQLTAELTQVRSIADTYIACVTEHNGLMDNECYNLRTKDICTEGSPLEPCDICPLRHQIKVPE